MFVKKIIFLLLFTFYPTFAYAYIDPGTVSIILQGLIGALAATIVTLKIYWYKVLKFLNIKQKKDFDQENENKDTK
jgi:uncharacterized membrane protein (DUF485 family)